MPKWARKEEERIEGARASERASEPAKADMPDFVFASAEEADSREGGTTTGNGYSDSFRASRRVALLLCNASEI